MSATITSESVLFGEHPITRDHTCPHCKSFSFFTGLTGPNDDAWLRAAIGYAPARHMVPASMLGHVVFKCGKCGKIFRLPVEHHGLARYKQFWMEDNLDVNKTYIPTSA